MRAPSCVACGLPILSLVGQSVLLAPYLSVAGSPPVSSAGEWHCACLVAAPVAPEWGAAHVRSFLQTRGYERAGRIPEWTVVRNPRTGEVLALGDQGTILPLSGRTVRGRRDGALRLVESEFWLEWDPPVIAELQASLRRDRTVPVLRVAELLGLADRLADPEVLGDSVFTVDDELVEEWRPSFVGVGVDYAARLPAGLAPYLAP